jgi:hypothetical protein
MDQECLSQEFSKELHKSNATPEGVALTLDPKKPLGHRAYGHIAHLPGSRTGEKDKHISEGQAKICTEKARDRHDLIIVQEKLDGSNVGVAKINGEIIPLIRAGYKAISSRFKMHHLFHNWAVKNKEKFEVLLEEGQRCCGEWLLQAHGTIYDLPHEPFVAFDLMREQVRSTWEETQFKCQNLEITTANTFHVGQPINIKTALSKLGKGQHGAIDPVEGAVWRVERHNKVDFLAKYVRPEKRDGIYLPDISTEIKSPIWNKFKGDN